jgi:thioredoxin 1
MIAISETEFAGKVEQSTKPVLVDFSATWCPPCKMLHPIVQRIGLEFQDKMDVYTVDIDENPGLSTRFNISGVPTMMVFREGKEVKKMVGFRDYDTLKKELESVV